MKKWLALALSLTLCLTLLAACGPKENTDAPKGDEGKKDELVTLKVGASPTPHAEILEAVKPLLKEKGIDLVIQEYNDYIIPNQVVESGELDANYFQHITYMNDFNTEKGTHLVSAAEIHYEPFGLYPGKTDTIANLPDEAVIAIPNDGTNEARALKLLEAQGLIKLSEDADMTATILDIAEKPEGLTIEEVEAAQIPRMLDSVDMAVINGNYALQAGLNAAENAVAVEAADSEAAKLYVNVLAVKEGSEDSETIKALVEALTSDTARQFMEDTYQGGVVPTF